MREIKFRGMSIGGKWFHGLVANTDEHGWTISNSVGRPFAHKVRPETVTQYTALKDKAGVEIYEGDICYITDGWGNEWTSKVEWGDNHGDNPAHYPAFDLSPQVDEELNSFASIFESGDFSIKVIGNIYENPELISAKPTNS